MAQEELYTCIMRRMDGPFIFVSDDTDPSNYRIPVSGSLETIKAYGEKAMGAMEYEIMDIGELVERGAISLDHVLNLDD